MRIKLKYPDVDTFIQKYAVNISRGGIFIATRTPKPVGTVVRFEFQLASAQPVIRGEGQVIWVKDFDPAQPQRVHGMGLRFLRLDPESRAMVDRALAWKKEHEDEGAESQRSGGPAAEESTASLSAESTPEPAPSPVAYPEEAALAELLQPVRVALPSNGKEAARLLEALLAPPRSG